MQKETNTQKETLTLSDKIYKYFAIFCCIAAGLSVSALVLTILLSIAGIKMEPGNIYFTIVIGILLITIVNGLIYIPGMTIKIIKKRKGQKNQKLENIQKTKNKEINQNTQ